MKEVTEHSAWVSWFRHASPYIKAHQNKTMVLGLSGEALASRNLENLIHDIALLNCLGVKLVLVFGGRPQIDKALHDKGFKSTFHMGLRVTQQEMLPAILEAYGRLRAELEAKLSTGLVNSPMHGVSVRVVSGNFVTAKPVGVLDGVDFACTGQFRKLDKSAMRQHLDNKDVVLVPALGYSASGEIFNLGYEQLAGAIAEQLNAEKLILFSDANGVQDSSQLKLKQLSIEQAERIAESDGPQLSKELKSHLKVAATVCRNGVERTHLIAYTRDEALLQELFTRDGSGTMVFRDNYDEIRRAQIDDINGILELIGPLEEQGILVKRSRERIESELDCFFVNVRDNAIIACAALYQYPENNSAELSCFAVAEEYRKEGRGDALLLRILDRAEEQNVENLFVLTTQTEHWFKERGFENAELDRLPGAKLYNLDRNAKVLVRNLQAH